MKKKKNKKENKIDFPPFDYAPFKEYLEKQVIYNGIADSVSAEVSDEDEGNITLQFDCGEYIVKITCEDLLGINIEYSFKYPNCDTEFDIVDIFNVLNINDFNEYSFMADADDVENQKKTIDDLLYVIKKYDYDIRKAGGEEYLDDMIKMHQADKELFDSDALKFSAIIRAARLRFAMQKKKDEKSKQAFLKEMNKRESKNLLSTNDKRYKAYIEQGYPIPDNYDTEDNNDFSGYMKKAALTSIISIACGLIISFAIFFIDRNIISGKGLFLTDNTSYMFALISGGFLSYLINRIFGTKIIVALSPEEQKEYVKKERLQRYDEDNLITRIWSKYVIFAVSVVVAPLMMLVACSGVCFNEDCIIDHSIIGNTEISYDEAEVYLLQGWYDDDDNYNEYESPCYRIEYGEDSSIETGEINNTYNAEMVEHLFETHNVEVTELKD